MCLILIYSCLSRISGFPYPRKIPTYSVSSTPSSLDQLIGRTLLRIKSLRSSSPRLSHHHYHEIHNYAKLLS
ncbi:hypothetical protein F5Y02DRAFT_372113 [Annulohypoxylon stygium]|nr:hypothetical protein F5Y02DRAFT_372113 [Annulohypoxylon stygium]